MSTSSRWLVALRVLVLASAGAFAFASVSAPSGLSAKDADGVRSVVQAQLDALASSDAAKALSFASPDVQHSFASAEQFMALVRAQYPMVQRPASVTYTRPEPVGDRVMQRVHLMDSTGSAWVVTYLLHRDKDRRWRISACVVEPGQYRVMA